MPNADFEQILGELSRFDQVIATPEPIIQLADPSELYPPVEVHATEDQVVTIHVDDHVHLEKSFNKSHHNKSLNQSQNNREQNKEQLQDTTNVLGQLDFHHGAPTHVSFEENKIVTIEIPAEDINDGSEKKQDQSIPSNDNKNAE